MHEPAACFCLKAISSSSSSLVAFLGFLSNLGVLLENGQGRGGEWGEAGTVRTVNRLGAVWEQVSYRSRVEAHSYLLPIPEGMIANVCLVDRVG